MKYGLVLLLFFFLNLPAFAEDWVEVDRVTIQDMEITYLVNSQSINVQGNMTNYWYKALFHRKFPGVELKVENTYYQAEGCENGVTYGPFVAIEAYNPLQSYLVLDPYIAIYCNKLPPEVIASVIHHKVCDMAANRRKE